MEDLRDKIENLICAQDEYARLLVEASVNGCKVNGDIYIMLSDAKDRLMEEMRSGLRESIHELHELHE